MHARNTEDNWLIQIENLKVVFTIDGKKVNAVNGAGFAVRKGEIFGLVGESGSGKTITSLSILGLVPPPGRIAGGKIILEGSDLLQFSETQMETVRGSRIGMIFQEPMTALNPVFKIGDQIAETIATHNPDLTAAEVRKRTITLLSQVGFDEPENRYAQYPHQLSGGQRQRVLTAIAISCSPSLLIADEPTTALDVATESQVIRLLEKLVKESGMSMVFITHNLNIIRRLGHRIGIMYAGKVVEQNTVKEFFENPLHPYSRTLLDSVEGLSGNERRLSAIPGYVPKLTELPRGCAFHPRCPRVMPMCKSIEPPIKEIGNDKWVRCYLYRS